MKTRLAHRRHIFAVAPTPARILSPYLRGMGLKIAVASLICLGSLSAARADSFSRKDMSPHLPSMVKWRDPKVEVKDPWIQVLLRYSPHYILLAGDDVDTTASIASKLSHRLGVGIRFDVHDNDSISLNYNFDMLRFEPNQDVATLTERSLYLSDFSILNEYYLEEFIVQASAGRRERPYYNRLGSNVYDLERDRHWNFMIGTKYLLASLGRYYLGLGANYNLYLAGEKPLPGNGDGSGFEGSIDIGRQTYTFETSRYQLGLALYYRYEFAHSGSADRTVKDVGLIFRFDYYL